jgi:hypothetical protein
LKPSQWGQIKPSFSRLPGSPAKVGSWMRRRSRSAMRTMPRVVSVAESATSIRLSSKKRSQSSQAPWVRTRWSRS